MCFTLSYRCEYGIFRCVLASLYDQRVCPSVHLSVHPSVPLSVTHFFLEFTKLLNSYLNDGYKVGRRHTHAHRHTDTHRHTHTQTRGPQWVGTAWNWRIQFIDKNLFPMSSGASEWAIMRICRSVHSLLKLYEIDAYSTGPFACPLARSLALLTCLLAPHCSLWSRARMLTHSLPSS